MPLLKSLSIQHLRNLVSVDLEPGPSFNIFYGQNASGKTSLLEAISLLSSNRSFRTNKNTYLVSREQEKLTLFCALDSDDELDPTRHKIGIERPARGNTNTRIRLDGENVKSASSLAKTLPLIALEPTTFELLDGAPSLRRVLLDWLVFHVKPEFLSAWKNYQRCLKQRNILLRRGKITRSELYYWDELLCSEAVIVEQSRRAVLARFQYFLLEELTCTNTDFTGRLSLSYRDGWGLEDGVEINKAVLLDRLDDNFDKDLKQGFSSIGSHKHDLAIRIDTLLASEMLSRGQKKTLIVACYLALAKSYIEYKKSFPVFLLDDLPSELDSERLQWLCESLSALHCQIFITAVNKTTLAELESIKNNKQCRWFHVKHGCISLDIT